MTKDGQLNREKGYRAGGDCAIQLEIDGLAEFLLIASLQVCQMGIRKFQD
jgi:hypothetical protein